MARNGTWLVWTLALAGAGAADDALLQQWDAPKRETFALKRMPGREAALEVRRRYGYDFECPATDAEVALKVKDATYFEALDRLAAGLGLFLVGVPLPEAKRGHGEAGLGLTAADGPAGPVVAAYLGPSRLSVESVSIVAVRRCTPRARPSVPGVPSVIADEIARDLKRLDADGPRLRLELSWIVEPGFDDVVLAGMTLIQALDDGGRPLRALHDPRLPVSANATLELDFERPAAKVKSIRRIQGSVRVLVPVERGEVSFAFDETGAPKTLGGASITLDGVDGTTVRLTLVGTPAGVRREGLVPLDVGTARPGFRAPWGPADVTLAAYDEKGAEIPGHERESGYEDGRCTYKVELERAPRKLVFRAVTRVAAREVPFLLGGIPLPE